MELVKANDSEADFQRFLKLEKEFNSYYDSLGIGEQYVRIPADKIPVADYKKEFLSYLAGGSYFVFIREQNDYAGYISGSVDKLPSGYQDGLVGHLDSVIVTEKYCQQGLDKILMDSFFEWLRQQGVEICQLHVKAKNIKAVSYYEKMGFEVDNLRMWMKI